MDDMQDLAVELVLAIMRSASTEKIRPMDWWVRAQSAMHSAAAMAQGYGQMVSIMGRKLQIATYTQNSAIVISSIGRELKNEEGFELFRDMCESDTLYIVAEAQARRMIEREEREQHGCDDQEIGEAGL
jgi:hypothetical protein